MVAVGAIMYFVGYHFGKQEVVVMPSSELVTEVDSAAVAKNDTVSHQGKAASPEVPEKPESPETPETPESSASPATPASPEPSASAKAEAYAKAEAAKKAAYEAEVKKQQAQQNQQQQANTAQTGDNQKALNNARSIVNTGAYSIVGTDQVITVRKGQTLDKISKAYFGPGMEAYIIVHNGVTQVSEGMKLKIPKLSVKAKKK